MLILFQKQILSIKKTPYLIKYLHINKKSTIFAV